MNKIHNIIKNCLNGAYMLGYLKRKIEKERITGILGEGSL